MSDSGLEDKWSLKGMSWMGTGEIGGTLSLESERATSSPESERAIRSLENFHQEDDCVRHVQKCHAAYRLPDCRLGFVECKHGLSCCQPVWNQNLEEPLAWKWSMPVVLKTHKSLGTFPEFLSNLPAPVTSFDPSTFGKDLLKITLPLPEDPDECKAKSLSCDEPCRTVWPSGSMVCEQSEVSDLFSHLGCDETKEPRLETNDSVTRSVFQASKQEVAGVLGAAESHEESFPASPHVSLSSKDSSLEGSVNIANTSSHKFVSANKVSSTLISRQSWKPDEFGLNNGNMHQARSWRVKSKHKASTSPQKKFDIKETDKEDSEEGYLNPDEQEEGHLENTRYDGDVAEGYATVGNATDNNEDIPEDLLTGGTTPENSITASREDDIWSDEDFVSTQVKGFPPPIGILANETHPGLPGHMPRTLWRSVKRGGRFVLQEVQAQPREFFQAIRENGRLRLQLIRPHSDSSGSFTDEGTSQFERGADEENLGAFYDDKLSHENVKPEYLGHFGKKDTLIGGPGSPCPVGSTERLDTCLLEEHGTVVEKDNSSCAVMSARRCKILQPLCHGSIQHDVMLVEPCCFDDGSQMAPACFDDESQIAPAYGQHVDYEKFSTIDIKCTDKLIDESVALSCPISLNGQVCGVSDGGKISNPYLEETIDKCSTHVAAERGSVEMETCDSHLRDENQRAGLSETMEHQRLGIGIQSETDQQQTASHSDRCGFPMSSDVMQVHERNQLELCNHSVVDPPSGHGNEEPYRQDYQHPCFNSTYGVDNNLNVLSSNQPFLQFPPIQPAVW